MLKCVPLWRVNCLIMPRWQSLGLPLAGELGGSTHCSGLSDGALAAKGTDQNVVVGLLWS